MNPPPPNEDREQPAALNYERVPPRSKNASTPPALDYERVRRSPTPFHTKLLKHLSAPAWVVGWPLFTLVFWAGCIANPHSREPSNQIFAWGLVSTGFALSFVSLFNRRRRSAAVWFVAIYAVLLTPSIYLGWPYFVRKYFE